MKTGEKITTDIANKSQNYDKNLKHLQKEVGEIQRSLIDNSHFENIGTLNSSPNKPFIGTPANGNRLKKFELINPSITERWGINSVSTVKYKIKLYNYDAHHLIKLEYGGPNTWWNIHPASKI